MTMICIDLNCLLVIWETKPMIQCDIGNMHYRHLYVYILINLIALKHGMSINDNMRMK